MFNLFGRSDAASEEGAPEDASSEAAALRARLASLLGMEVGDAALYEQALTHRSCARGQREGQHRASNERLEFLGDAVLGALVAEALYRAFPDETEGYLTRLRAKLVSGKALAAAAARIGLGALVQMSDNMAQSGGRENQTILSDAFEAVVGALWLERGLESARAFVTRTILEPVDLGALAGRSENYKSVLLEYVQARGNVQPTYHVLHTEGPAHDRRFTVEVRLGAEALGGGQAGSKKRAEQQAAREALRRLRAGGERPADDT